jgi:cell division protein FtsI/penicillin-binding protein 2
VYPHGPLAAHVVGFATVDGDGVEGIELAYDEALDGEPTVYLVVQDARDGRLRELVRAPQKRPVDVVLTLDAVLQYVVERELEAAMAATGSRAALGILLDPRTGDVLALANRPSPDLNAFGRADDRARLNRAVVAMFEPGSTFKIVPIAAALDRGRIDVDRPIWCENGVFRSGRRVIHDVSRHGLLTPEEILEKSSNIGMVKIANTLSPTELHDAIAAFGFGHRTGIELPGESAGSLQPTDRWSGFTHASLSFGQEVGVTGLQLASAFGALANDGLRVPPRIVVGTRDADGKLLPAPRPEPVRAVSARTARLVGRMLENVVENGTGRRARVPGYRVAGKSGTAQKALPEGGYSAHDYVASFVAYAPVRAPRVVCLVVLDSPRGAEHQGGQVAAPVVGRILADALPHLRVPQDPEAFDTDEADAPQVAAHDASADTAEDLEPEPQRQRVFGPDLAPDVLGLGLRDAVAMLTGHGCRVHVTGHGTVVDQVPLPGAALDGVGTCSLRLDGRNRG